MNPPIQDKRQPLPSILTVYPPIEEYWESSRLAGCFGAGPSDALHPLDAFLVHRILELIPGSRTLIDAAISRTGGLSSLVGLAHPHVRGVWAVTEQGSLLSERAISALRDHVRSHRPELAPLEVISRTELPAVLVDEPEVVILTDARVGDAGFLAAEIDRWLDERPDALVLMLGIGRIGDCPAIASLLPLCGPGSGKKLWLLRELSEVLMASHLGVIARQDHPHLTEVFLRLGNLFTGNYKYLDLIRQVNLAALREARIDAEVLRGSWTFGPMSMEVDELKRKAREAEEQATVVSQALASRESEIEDLRWALQEARAQLAALPPWPRTFLMKVRRKLAQTRVGSAWRTAKEVRRKLAPTPVGKSYRLARRIVRSGLVRGR